MTIFRKPNPKTGSAAVAKDRLKSILMMDRYKTQTASIRLISRWGAMRVQEQQPIHQVGT